MTLEEESLNGTDQGIIDELARGRASPRLLASRLEKQQPYINQRLKRLVEHGHVRRVDRGLYELVERPGEDTGGYREKALREYGEKCQVCGDAENVVVHHRDGDSSNDSLSNLIPLCEEHHGKVHGASKEVEGLVEELGKKPREEGATAIQVSDELADELYQRKQRGDSYEDVIWRLLDTDERRADDAEPVADPGDDTDGFMPPVVGLEFEKQATDKRVMVVEEWLEHVRDDGRVQKSDFEAWYSDDHAERTGYEPGGFWDFFVKPAMRQVEGIDRPNSRTYVWVGSE